MDFPFHRNINNLHIHSCCEETLNDLASLVKVDNTSGHLWITEAFSVKGNWDLSFWLKRASSNCLAFDYDTLKDERVDLPLIFSSKNTLPKREEISNSLPLTYKGSKSAFFLDRDGIINVDKSYVYKKEDVEFMPGVVDFIQYLQSAFDYVIVLTNQSGVGRGYYKESDVLALHQWMSEDLEKSEARIDDWYYCPYHPKGEVQEYQRDSYLRKPGAAMALRAAKDHDLDLSRCAMTGDKTSDYLKDLQLKTYLIKGNYPLDTDLPQFDSLEDLKKYLISKN